MNKIFNINRKIANFVSAHCCVIFAVEVFPKGHAFGE